MTEPAQGRPMSEGAAAQALIHFYRGELARSDTWRTRLDTTTNWAVGTTAALLSIAFSHVDVPSVVFPFAAALLSLFLGIEARRYRYYEVSIARVRVMERAFLAPLLAQRDTDGAALTALAEQLERPAIHVTVSDAVAVRLWRAYTWLFAIVYVAWFAKVWAMPYELTSLSQAYDRLGAGPIDGRFVLGGATALFLWLALQTTRGFRLTRREGGPAGHAPKG